MQNDAELLSAALGLHVERLSCTVALKTRCCDKAFPFSNLGRLFQG